MSPDSIAFDLVLGLCQHQHRRIVLGIPAEEQRSLTFSDLTGAILKYNHQTQITEASEDVLTEIRQTLHHVHLPKLVSERPFNYGPKHQLVEPAEQLYLVHPTLSTILDADPSFESPMKL